MQKLVDLLQRFVKIDRRYIFLAMAVVIVVPLLFPIGLPITAQPPVKAMYDEIMALPPGERLLVSADFDPASKPEIQPFFEAMLDLAFRRDLRVVVMSLWPQAPPLVEDAWKDIGLGRHKKVYGIDFVNLGFKEGKQVVMNQVGESLTTTFPRDDRGTPVQDIPIMRGVGGLSDFPLMICLSSGFPGAYEWVPQVQGRFIKKIGAATTSVVAPDLIPYLGSGQMVGLVGGMSGAAQFEQLVGRPGMGTSGMEAQSFAHLLIIIAIILANIAYFTSTEFKLRRRR